jgi:hypothetical protein
MTRPPQPLPYPGDPGTAALPGQVRYRRRYTDALGRAMSGHVAIVNRGRIATPDGSGVVPASSVRVDVVDGWLDVPLSPGAYLLKAQLTTRDGGTFVDDDTVHILPT